MTTIPRRWSARAAARLRGRRGDRRRRPRGWTFAELAAARRAAARAFVASGRRAGRPGGDLGAEHPRVGGRRARASPAGGVARAAQHALQGRRGGLTSSTAAGRRIARCSSTGSSGNDYVACSARAEGGAPSTSSTIVVLRGDAPDGTSPWADFIAAGAIASTTPTPHAPVPCRPRRHSATSSSRPAPPDARRA